MKKYTISENSWHLKFNRWTFGKLYTPTNLCPYFWKTFLAFVIMPFVLICKGFDRLYINTPDWTISENTSKKISDIVKSVGLAFVTIILILLAVYGIWQALVGIGIILGVMFGLYGLVLVVQTIHQKYRATHPKKFKPKQCNKQTSRSLIITKAQCWYERKCPLMEVSG